MDTSHNNGKDALSRRPRYIAEYLPNIKAISISIQLQEGYEAVELDFPTVKEAILSYKHNESDHSYTEHILLPQDVKASIMAIKVHNKSPQLSFRLPASPDLNTSVQKPLFETPYPWSAHDLTKAAATGTIGIGCRWCQQPFIKPNQVENWKPLPSEHWAELMDYWHCHKPDSLEDHGNRIPDEDVSKDYTRALIPSVKTCLVGTSYFSFNADAVQNLIEVATDKRSFAALAILKCSQCNNSAGIKDPLGIMKLYKWSIVMLGSSSLSRQYSDQVFVSSLISERIDSHSIYCLYIQDEDENKKSDECLIKVFNPKVTYTFPGFSKVKHGVKIFFSTDRDAFPELMQTIGDVEIVSLTSPVLRSVKQTLLAINGRYPDNAQTFGQWKTGILESYTTES